MFRRARLASWIIVGVAALELILFDRISVSNRSTVTKQELKARIGYNDETVDAIRDIKASGVSIVFAPSCISTPLSSRIS